MRRIMFSLVALALAMAGAIHAQSPTPGVPRFVPASGMLFDQAGKPLDGNNIKITFSVYANAGDQEPLWSETVKVQVTAGRYDTLIGSSSTNGIPSGVFTSGDARWLGITAEKAVAPPRSLLVSVPYALSSDDASKLGGHPASAFVLKEDPNAATSSSTPSGWKQAVDEEAAARADSDTTLQNNVDGETSARLAADTSLQDSLDGAKSELNAKIDSTKSEFDTKIDATKNELNGKILFETSKVTNDQDSKLQALKNELQSDSSQKVNELDLKKTSKEEFEFEKSKKTLEIDDIKLKKLEKNEFEQEKQTKQALIDDLHQKKLAKDEYLLDKLQKDFDISDLKQKKAEKTDFEAEKTSKQQQIDDINAKLIAEKDRVDTLAKFVVAFAREPNGEEMPDRWMCPEGTVAIGIVGQAADPLGTASPFCSPVTGAMVRADGNLAATFNGPFAVPGLDGAVPTYELMCPASHAVVGIDVGILTTNGIQITLEDEAGNIPMRARCRRMFSAIVVSSAASVTAPAQPPSPICPSDQTAAGIVRLAASIQVVCR